MGVASGRSVGGSVGSGVGSKLAASLMCVGKMVLLGIWEALVLVDVLEHRKVAKFRYFRW